MATVCRSFSSAVKAVLADRVDVNLTGAASKLPRMDSKLLVAWASANLWCLTLDGASCRVPGMVDFVRASAELQELDISCSDMLAWTGADAMVAGCGRLTTLRCRDWYVPSGPLPPLLHTLEVELQGWAMGGRYGACPGMQTQALLFKMSALQHLQHLTLHLGRHVSLPSQAKLPALKTASISFCFQEEEIDLRWLQMQPVDHLHLHILNEAYTTEDVARLVSQLQLLNIHDLLLEVGKASLSVYTRRYSLHAQRELAKLTVLGRLEIVLPESSVHLEALPQCLGTLHLSTSGVDCCHHISWAALCSRTSRVCLWPTQNATMMLLGFCGRAPDAPNPWQLVAMQPHLVLNLHVMNPDVGRVRYKLQNEAADAAGW